MKESLKKYLGLGICAFGAYLAISYWDPFVKLLGKAMQAASPLFIGAVMAYAVNILMNFYESHFFVKSQSAVIRKSTRPVCMLAAFLTTIVIIVFVLQMVIPELISCVKLLLAGVPEVMTAVVNWLSKLEFVPEDIIAALEGTDWRAMLTKVINVLASGIGSTVTLAMGAVSTVISTVMKLIISTIFAIYLLIGKERLQAQANRLLRNYLRPSWNEKLHYVLETVNDSFHKFIVGQCTEAVILGALCAVGMFLFRFPYAVMTGVVIGVTALIPVAGAYIGGAVGFLLILTSDSLMKAALFLIFLVVLQQLEGNLIYPRVVGKSIGLPGIWVLSVVTIGGGILGITGMLLGVPLAAATYRLLRNDMNRKESGSK